MGTTEYTYQVGEEESASVIHTSSPDGKHQVGISLRVLIQPEGKFWYAQGLEIDYGAQGSTAEEAKGHFEEGLSGTIKLHLQKHGNVKKLLKRVDNKRWDEAVSSQADVMRLTQVSFHSIAAENAELFPYPMVEYYQAAA